MGELIACELLVEAIAKHADGGDDLADRPGGHVVVQFEVFNLMKGDKGVCMSRIDGFGGFSELVRGRGEAVGDVSWTWRCF